MSAIDIYLNDGRVVGIELTPSEVAPQQQQRIATRQCVIAAFRSEHTGHADVEGVCMFQKVFGPGGVCDRRSQLPGQRDYQIVGAAATGAAVDSIRLPLLSASAMRSSSASEGRITGWVL
jgi:hypothetical protein